MNEALFSPDYVAPSGTQAPKEPSVVKEFLKEPLHQQELTRYGTSKPQRHVVRAKLVHGKD